MIGIIIIPSNEAAILPVAQMNISPSKKCKNGLAMVNESSADNQIPTGVANTNANVIIANCATNIDMIKVFVYFLILFSLKY